MFSVPSLALCGEQYPWPAFIGLSSPAYCTQAQRIVLKPSVLYSSQAYCTPSRRNRDGVLDCQKIGNRLERIKMAMFNPIFEIQNPNRSQEQRHRPKSILWLGSHVTGHVNSLRVPSIGTRTVRVGVSSKRTVLGELCANTQRRVCLLYLFREMAVSHLEMVLYA